MNYQPLIDSDPRLQSGRKNVAITSAGILIMGLYYAYMTSSATFAIMAIISLITICSGLIGIIGAWKKSLCLLKTYSFFLVILILMCAAFLIILVIFFAMIQTDFECDINLDENCAMANLFATFGIFLGIYLAIAFIFLAGYLWLAFKHARHYQKELEMFKAPNNG